MMLPGLENLAQTTIARVLNCLPAGILIAAFAWGMLRLLPRQNSRTRFAVWFVTLLTVIGLPFMDGFAPAHSLLGRDATPSLVTLSDRWAFVLLSVWILVVCAALAHLGFAIWRLHALRVGCKVIAAADLSPGMAEMARKFSSAHSVTLASSDQLNVPAAIGFFHPMIVIPRWALEELTPEEFKIILLHEVAHLRRRDNWTNLLQKTVRAFFIFHPAVWWIERQLSREREMACDDHVLAETGNPRAYAKCLVALLERSFARRAWAMAQAAVHRAEEARARLSRILDRNRMGGRRFGKPAVALAGVLSVLCFGIVPHAPKLVAFAPAASEPQALSTPAFAAAPLPRVEFASASVIPASMHVRTSPARASAPLEREHGRVHAIATPARTSSVAPRWVKARASERAVPAETILVIRTTEQIGPDAWISRLTVLRLQWVATRTQPVPVAKAT
jgi:beta-lactamase regulating signal transducer with metallopeptidase domain